MPDNPDVIIPIAPVLAKVSGPDLPPASKMTLVALNRLEKGIAALARTAQDVSHVVDEYSTESVTVDNILTINVFPEYDKMAERIESVIVTGPPSTAFTLTLGDRTWYVLTNTTGLFHIPYAGLLLARNDVRQLVSATAGNWTLELTGYADERYYAP
jgi:hypothetical protein